MPVRQKTRFRGRDYLIIDKARVVAEGFAGDTIRLARIFSGETPKSVMRRGHNTSVMLKQKTMRLKNVCIKWENVC